MATITNPGDDHDDYEVFPQHSRTLSFILMARMTIHFHMFQLQRGEMLHFKNYYFGGTSLSLVATGERLDHSHSKYNG
jgi:hypothetical protein